MFDLDGTLVATDRFWSTQRAPEHGAFGARHRARDAGEGGMNLVGCRSARLRSLFADLPAGKRVIERCTEEENNAFARAAALLPGVAETLEELRRAA